MPHQPTTPPLLSVRCVIVDDHPLMADVIARILSSTEGFTVQAVAYNGTTALAALRKQPADVVVLDLVLPDTSGIELISAIRAEQLAKKIVIWTGQQTDESIEVAFSFGADAYVEKTGSIEELLATIRAAESGRVPMNAHVSSVLRDAIRHKRAYHSLKPRDLQVIIGLSNFKSPKSLAFELGLSLSGLYKARARVIRRFGEENLPRLAKQLGLNATTPPHSS